MLSKEEAYFDSYSDLQIHALMLRDKERLGAYQTAVSSNPECFKGKVVMDVGAGTGILSILCAKEGAKKVYAVEACTTLVPILNSVVKDNGLCEIIEVILGDVDELTEEHIPEKVDVIISEWMGFYLLHESMLFSVLRARRFLKKDGLMFPSSCTIYMALAEVPEYHDWNNVNGVNLSQFGEYYRSYSSNQPQITTVNKENIFSISVPYFYFDCKTVQAEELNQIEQRFIVYAIRDGMFQGLCIWFEVEFPGGSTLSTGPYDEPTHWKQTVVLLPYEYPLEAGEPTACNLKMTRRGRAFEIEYEMLNPDEFELNSKVDKGADNNKKDVRD